MENKTENFAYFTLEANVNLGANIFEKRFYFH